MSRAAFLFAAVALLALVGCEPLPEEYERAGTTPRPTNTSGLAPTPTPASKQISGTTTVTDAPAPTPTSPAGGAFVAVSAGWQHSCAVRADGRVVCWGRDEYGQASPTEGKFVVVSAGWQHSCAVRASGDVECWGSDEYGQASPPEGEFVDVSAGERHSCAVRRVINHLALLRAADAGETVAPGSEYAGGGIECWGSDEYGQASPPPGGAFAAVSAGAAYSCAVRSYVTCWGTDGYGASRPRGLTAVSVGKDHSCGRIDGRVECWGSAFASKTAAPEGLGWIDVSAGASHSCAVDRDGTVECWGFNSHGRATPPEGAFTTVSAGGRHSCGVRADGRVECWGDDTFGQASPPGGQG